MSNTVTSKLNQSRNWTLALGIGAALLAAILLVVYLNRYRSSVNAENAATPVLVAKNLIPKGTSGTIIAKQELFQVASLPKNDLKVGAISDPAYLNGRVAATDVFPGQQITTADLSVDYSRDRSDAALTGSERAVAIPVDGARGLVGYTAQGDHVDVYVSLVGGRREHAHAARARRRDPARARRRASRRPTCSRPTPGSPRSWRSRPTTATLWFLLRPVVGAKKTPPLTITMQTLLAQANRNRTVR